MLLLLFLVTLLSGFKYAQIIMEKKETSFHIGPAVKSKNVQVKTRLKTQYKQIRKSDQNRSGHTVISTLIPQQNAGWRKHHKLQPHRQIVLEKYLTYFLSLSRKSVCQLLCVYIYIQTGGLEQAHVRDQNRPAGQFARG